MRYRYSKREDGRLVRCAQVWTAEEHGISKAAVDPLAVHICEKLSKEGFETYIVGGAVRDLLLNKTPKDFDIASAATPQKIKRIFSNSRIIGKRFRLVHIFFGNRIFEIATFRSARDSNVFGKIEEDVQRRDFTLNALFYDPSNEIVIDFVGGFRDMKKKRIRPIIPLDVIFREDPVRMVRAVKYAALSGFRLPFSLKRKIRRDSDELGTISPSRLTEEMNKILRSPNTATLVARLEEMGLYAFLQPEASLLLRASSGFRKRYFETFGNMDAENARGGGDSWTLARGLCALVKDYIDEVIDWESTGEDAYKSVFMLARKFVLPINPPRIELARAIRDIFADHGIAIPGWRRIDRF